MGATKNYLATAVTVAMLGAGFAAPAFADTTEDLLKSLRAKGVLSADEYDRLLKQQRDENKALATAQDKTDADTAKALKEADKALKATTISGRIYVDFTKKSTTTRASSTAASNSRDAGDGFGTDVTRFYIGIDHKFSDVWSASLTTDMQTARDPDANGRTNIFVKKAYLQAKIDPAFVIRAGSYDNPWIGYIDGLTGYRYIQNSLVDRIGFGNSADWGVHFSGDFLDKRLGYQLSVVNGRGYSDEARSEKVDFEGRIDATPIPNLKLAAGFYNGTNGQVTETNHGAATVATTDDKIQKATRTNFLVGYAKKEAYMLVWETYRARNYNNAAYIITNPAAPVSNKGSGWAVYADYYITPEWKVFGRYDRNTPSRGGSDRANFGTGLPTNLILNPIDDKYLHVGVGYLPVKGVNVSLVYKKISATGGTATPSRTSGDSVDGAKFDRNEIGIFTELRW